MRHHPPQSAAVSRSHPSLLELTPCPPFPIRSVPAILIKPTRPDIATNLVINTDRRTYHIELRANPDIYMASVSWSYPADELIALRLEEERAARATPVADGFTLEALNFDYHWGGVVKAALVSTLLGIGGELGAGGDDDLLRAVRRGSQDSINRAGEQVIARELDIRPTLTIRPGFPVRVLVTRDIVLEGGA